MTRKTVLGQSEPGAHLLPAAFPRVSRSKVGRERLRSRAMLVLLFALGCLLLVTTLPSPADAYSYDESVKVRRLLDGRNIDPHSVPVPGPPGSALKVQVSFMMTGLVHVDIAREKIKFAAVIFLRWRDYNLVWDLKDANTSAVMRPVRSIWYPQLLLTTSVNDLTIIRPDPRFDQIQVASDGEVILRIYETYSIRCKSHVVKFPVDHVDCRMSVTATADFDAVQLQPWNSTMKEMLLFPNVDSEWIIRNMSFFSTIERVKLFGRTYPNNILQVHIVANRSPAYYFIILQVPMFLLTCMIAVTTWIPADGGERIGFVVNLCLSFILFLMLLDTILPKSGYSAMAIFVLISYILSVVNFFECAVVSYFNHRYKCRDPACHPLLSEDGVTKDSFTTSDVDVENTTGKWKRYIKIIDKFTFIADVVVIVVMMIAVFVVMLN